MTLLHRHRARIRATASTAVAATDYDTQTDLALPTDDGAQHPGDVVAPFGGILAPVEHGVGYDLERDIAR
jgi:hypothetical protein